MLNLVFVKKRRRELGITLKEMAILLGFKSSSTYLKYENGIYLFKAGQLPVLANKLECEISDFFNPNISKTETNL